MEKVIITGATGYIGSNLARSLIGQYEVHVIVRKNSSKALLVECIRDLFIHVYDGTYDCVRQIVQSVRPITVIHLAAYYTSSHNSDNFENLYESNIKFGLHILEALREIGGCCLINIGSQMQHYYGEKYNPLNLYAATKEAYSCLLKYYTEASCVQAITLHLCDVYGPNDPREKLLNILVNCAQSGQRLEMTSGLQEVAFIYIDDAIDAIKFAINRVVLSPQSTNEVFTILPLEIYKLRTVVSILQEVLDTKIDVIWGAKAHREREMFSVYKENLLPGFKPKVNLKSGLKFMLELNKNCPKQKTYGEED